MPSSQIERKLAAIMFTDIAGYTALSAKDENKALALLDTQKQILTPIIEEFNGTLHKEMGDGLLFTFPTVTEAVKCGIKIQEDTKANDDLNLRIGIHEGEITLKDGDALGDDVNVASRIEAFAPSGGIAISSKVQQNISSLPEFETSYVGNPELKGVSQEVKVYCITSHGLPKADEIDEPIKVENKYNFNIFALTGGILTAIGIAFWIAVGVFDVSFGGKAEVPSVGILMMDNIGAEDDEFWARGITEDLIVKLAGAGLIRVSPMEEIMRISDLSLAIKEKAEILDVKYILTSSLHKKENEFDLRCQLIEAESGNSKYANKWSEPIENAPTIVGNLADNILKSLKVSTKQNIVKVPTYNIDAYEYYLKAKYTFERYKNLLDAEDLHITRDLVRKSIELDTNLFAAQILLGKTFLREYTISSETMTMLNEEAKNIFTKTLQQAEEIGDKLWIGRSLRNIGNSIWDINLDTTYDYYLRSLSISEEIGDKLGMRHSLHNIGSIYWLKGNFDKSIEYHLSSLSISQEIGYNRGINSALSTIGHRYLLIGNYDKSLEYSIRSLEISKERQDLVKIWFSLFNIGHVYFLQGDFELAQNYIEQSLEITKEVASRRIEPIIETYTYLYLIYKKVGTKYNKEIITDLLQEIDNSAISIYNMDYELRYRLYQLLENRTYLESAYAEVQEKADNLELNVAAKFLSYPIPKAIVEEWEKVK